MRRVVATAVASLLGALLACAVAPTAAAQSTGLLDFDARIDGQVVGEGNLIIDPTREANIEITVRNETGSLQRVKTVRLSGTALALTFFAYDTTVAFDVPAGATVERSFPLDLADLDRQATGLLPATVELLSPERETLAELSTTSDVRGSVWSVFGVFGIAVVTMTLLAWAGTLIALARGKLPANRWRRALRFLPAGFGTGLSAVITLSVLRLVAPAPAAEIPMVLGAAAAALLLGYLTPHPNPAVPDALDPAEAGTEHHDPFAPGQYGHGPTGQVATDYLVTGKGVPTYPTGQLPPGLMPPARPDDRTQVHPGPPATPPAPQQHGPGPMSWPAQQVPPLGARQAQNPQPPGPPTPSAQSAPGGQPGLSGQAGQPGLGRWPGGGQPGQVHPGQVHPGQAGPLSWPAQNVPPVPQQPAHQPSPPAPPQSPQQGQAQQAAPQPVPQPPSAQPVPQPPGAQSPAAQPPAQNSPVQAGAAQGQGGQVQGGDKQPGSVTIQAVSAIQQILDGQDAPPSTQDPQPGQKPVRPKQKRPAEDDLTVDANATVQAGLLSDFLERPDGRR